MALVPVVAVGVLKNAVKVAADEVLVVTVEVADRAEMAEVRIAGHAVRVADRIVDHVVKVEVPIVIVDRAVMGRAAMEIAGHVRSMQVVVISIVIVSADVISNLKVEVIRNSPEIRRQMAVRLSVMVRVEAVNLVVIRVADVIQVIATPAIATVIVGRAVKVSHVMGKVAVDRAVIIVDVVNMAGVRRVLNNVMVSDRAGRVRRNLQWLQVRALVRKSQASSRSCSEKNPNIDMSDWARAQLSVARCHATPLAYIGAEAYSFNS